LLLDLFRAHGIDAEPGAEWLELPKHGLSANACVVREVQQAGAVSVQLDVRLEFDSGRTLIESFVGAGKSRAEAICDAMHNFAVNSFHVILAAFLNVENDQVSEEQWFIGGKQRRVTIGTVGVRGNPPVQGEHLVGWFRLFEEKLNDKQLQLGAHWIRVYYGQLQGTTTACEVLLDNDVWDEMQAEMAAIAWPVGHDFYSVRVFLVVQDI
jgi:hypothetical protein